MTLIMRQILFSILFVLIGMNVLAQPNGGNHDFFKRVKAERDTLMARIADLDLDQKQIVVSIYKDFQTSISDLEANRSSGRQAFRQKIRQANEEKNLLITEVLNENQLEVFNQLLDDLRKTRQELRGNRRQGQKRRN